VEIHGAFTSRRVMYSYKMLYKWSPGVQRKIYIGHHWVVETIISCHVSYNPVNPNTANLCHPRPFSAHEMRINHAMATSENDKIWASGTETGENKEQVRTGYQRDISTKQVLGYHRDMLRIYYIDIIDIQGGTGGTQPI